MPYTFTDLTDQEVEIIGEGLDELQFKRVHALVVKLRAQIVEQQQATLQNNLADKPEPAYAFRPNECPDEPTE